MDKGPPERWEKAKKRMREQAKTIYFWLALSALSALSALLFWVAFGSKDDCSSHRICCLLGVTDKTEAIKLLGFAIAGVMAVWGVVVANRRAEAMAESAKAANNTAEAANKRANATEAGNRQRAFKDGVEHLGSDKPSVRQGGAHALFHLAMKDDGLRASIAGVLCAHIREATGKKGYQKKNKDKPSTEVQSLLRLLFTEETMDEGKLARFWQGATPDLSGGYFRGAELSNAQFRGAKLRSVQFQGASLEKAQFQGASLEKAKFQRAWLIGAQFQGALMWATRFQAANPWQAQFQGADLELAQFQGANLELAQFQGADLKRVQFQGARLSGSQFQGASLYMAGFQQARLGEERGDIPVSGYDANKRDEIAEQLKTSAFHGVSSGFPDIHTSFEKRIEDRTDKQSNFSKVIFSGGMTQELLAEVKEALERASWFDYDPDFKEGLIRNLESEIDKPVSNEPPAGVAKEGEGSYGKKEADEWIQEFHKVMETAPKTNQTA